MRPSDESQIQQGDSALPDSVRAAIEAIASLSDEQRARLLALVAASRSDGTSNDSASSRHPPESSPPQSNTPIARDGSSDLSEPDGSGSTSAHLEPKRAGSSARIPYRIFSLLGQGARRIRPDRSFLQDTFVNTLPVLLAVVTAPFVVQFSFERERQLAEPIISIEYVFLSRRSEPLPKESTETLSKLSRDPTYRAFINENGGVAPHVDLATFQMSSISIGPNLKRDLISELAAFDDYLRSMDDELDTTLTSLDALSTAELRTLAFRFLDDIAPNDDGLLHEHVVRGLTDKITSVGVMLEHLSRLKQDVVMGGHSIRARVTLLNKGATDGLVRHHGEIDYRGTNYPMMRTNAPSADMNVMAVPTFQTNEPGDDFSPQSVGKIEQDSMVEFWFEFTPETSAYEVEPGLCGVGEELQITLYDHNKNPVSKLLECNEE